MNEQTPIINTPNIPTLPVEEVKTEVKPTSLNSIQNKVLFVLKDLWEKFKESRFYKNKKVFWPITIGVGLIFLTLIIGILFGNRNGASNSTENIPTPTPRAQDEVVEESGGIIFQTEQKLKDLKTKITGYDTKQGRLKPPPINFDVKF